MGWNLRGKLNLIGVSRSKHNEVFLYIYIHIYKIYIFQIDFLIQLIMESIPK